MGGDPAGIRSTGRDARRAAGNGAGGGLDVKVWRFLPRHARVLLPLAAIHLVTLLVLRGAFWAAFHRSFPQLAPSVLARALFIGAKFDLRLTLLTLLPPALLGWPRALSLVTARLGRAVWTVYLGLAVALTAVAYAVDVGYFAYLHSRLTAQALDLLADTGIALRMVWETYPVVWAALAVIAVVAGYLAVVRRLIRAEVARTVAGVRRRTQVSVVAVAVFLWGFGIWGKLQWYPLRWSDAYFATDEWSAALGLNPVLHLADTFKNKARGFDAAALRAHYGEVAAYLGVDRPDPVSLSFRREVPSRRVPGRAPNIVVIFLESASQYETGVFGNPLKPTPNLDALANAGILFRHYYAPAFGTARSVFAFVTGIPDVETHETATRNPLVVRQHTIINAFAGYEKLYFLGGSMNWGNVRGVMAHNIPGLRLFEEGSYKARRVDVWGISDLALFEEANATLRAIGDTPFFAVIQTSGHHRPYTIPADNRSFVRLTATPEQLRAAGFEELDEYNSFRFMDHALGTFFADARREAYFDNTIFIMFGDHGRFTGSDRLARQENAVGLMQLHVPAVIYGRPVPGAPRVIEAPASEVDVLPTLAGLAGLGYVNTTLGRDLLDPRFAATRFAFTIADHYTNPKIGLVTADGYLQTLASSGTPRLYDLRGEEAAEITGQDPERVAALSRLCHGLYEAARWLMYHNGA